MKKILLYFTLLLFVTVADAQSTLSFWKITNCFENGVNQDKYQYDLNNKKELYIKITVSKQGARILTLKDDVSDVFMKGQFVINEDKSSPITGTDVTWVCILSDKLVPIRLKMQAWMVDSTEYLSFKFKRNTIEYEYLANNSKN